MQLQTSKCLCEKLLHCRGGYIKRERQLYFSCLSLLQVFFNKLHRKTVAAAAGAGGIGVVKVKTFAVQAVGEVEFRAGQV